MYHGPADEGCEELHSHNSHDYSASVSDCVQCRYIPLCIFITVKNDESMVLIFNMGLPPWKFAYVCPFLSKIWNKPWYCTFLILW
jgi:hypothetical protein